MSLKIASVAPASAASAAAWPSAASSPEPSVARWRAAAAGTPWLSSGSPPSVSWGSPPSPGSRPVETGSESAGRSCACVRGSCAPCVCLCPRSPTTVGWRGGTGGGPSWGSLWRKEMKETSRKWEKTRWGSGIPTARRPRSNDPSCCPSSEGRGPAGADGNANCGEVATPGRGARVGPSSAAARTVKGACPARERHSCAAVGGSRCGNASFQGPEGQPAQL